MTGADHAAPFRSNLTSQKTALRALRRAGHADHVALVASLFEEIPVAFVTPGDIAVIATPEGDALGIVQGEVIYVQSLGGVGALPLLDAHRAFRVS